MDVERSLSPKGESPLLYCPRWRKGGTPLQFQGWIDENDPFMSVERIVWERAGQKPRGIDLNMVRAGELSLTRGNGPYSGWTESLSVDGEAFVEEIQEALEVRASGHSVISDGEQQQLRDLQTLQRPFCPRNGPFKPK